MEYWGKSERNHPERMEAKKYESLKRRFGVKGNYDSVPLDEQKAVYIAKVERFFDKSSHEDIQLITDTLDEVNLEEEDMREVYSLLTDLITKIQDIRGRLHEALTTTNTILSKKDKDTELHEEWRNIAIAKMLYNLPIIKGELESCDTEIQKIIEFEEKDYRLSSVFKLKVDHLIKNVDQMIVKFKEIETFG